MSRRLKKRHALEYVDADINIMPFIDVFSILNTFLLFSAVFLSVGIIKVQIPFFTNKEVPPTAKRVLDVKVDLQKEKVTVVTSYSAPPQNPQQWSYTTDQKGIAEMHSQLVTVRKAEQETDLVTLFSDDDVTYEMLTNILDAIKLRKDGDPMFTITDKESGEAYKDIYLFPKVVMGSIVL